MTIQEMKDRLMTGKEPELFQKLEKCRTPEDAYEVVKKAGVTSTKEEALSVLKTLKVSLGELSGDQMAKVAGGSPNPQKQWDHSTSC